MLVVGLDGRAHRELAQRLDIRIVPLTDRKLKWSTTATTSRMAHVPPLSHRANSVGITAPSEMHLDQRQSGNDGRMRMDEVFKAVREASEADVLVYVDSHTILTPSFMRAVESVNAHVVRHGRSEESKVRAFCVV